MNFAKQLFVDINQITTSSEKHLFGCGRCLLVVAQSQRCLFSQKEEEDHNEHGAQQEDRIVLSVDIKGLVGLWSHGNGC